MYSLHLIIAFSYHAGFGPCAFRRPERVDGGRGDGAASPILGDARAEGTQQVTDTYDSEFQQNRGRSEGEEG